MSYHKAKKFSATQYGNLCCKQENATKVLSTGVLVRNRSTHSSVVNVVNLSEIPEKFIIEVWDWSSYHTPKKLSVKIGQISSATFPYTLAPNNLAVFFTFLAPEYVTFYEVRIYYSGSKKVIFNAYGRTGSSESLEGETILQHEFTELN
ncbi:hypothetical protein CHN50_00425 [Priestia aryabhattai]|uniref:hypothetical protein n=1 Tax=Bacillaceae TaxID=186817 RepID=UPI000BA02A31|nr:MULTISPECIES: hypothetical protein [Bacillaceae]MDT2047356.1 hypothetical protein [Priestia flexa]OZT14091.1 hypothetical protein CHN50_00425 [Priestia aryabhattai]TDB55101.1 hypothetical protein EPL02_02575 [Bacillus sp. CBEL-1]USY56516.1 hypothetical protein NIZ91_07635 [Bacillus sp. 1780r2a1]